MSHTSLELESASKQEQYLRWREHMRPKSQPVPEKVAAATPSVAHDWSPDSLFADPDIS